MAYSACCTGAKGRFATVQLNKSLLPTPTAALQPASLGANSKAATEG